MELKKELSKHLKEIPKKINSFGTIFTDHMFMMDYTEGKGWHSPIIKEYTSFLLEPSTMVFHYAQAIFEGMKAFRNIHDEIVIFRPKDHFKRFNRSAERMCIPQIDENFLLESLVELIKIDKHWVPKEKGTSLYIRPFIIATDPFLGVRPSLTYKLFIILSPVGAYYPEGLKPVKILVTDKYVRAVPGGIGNVKTGGNYAASLKAAREAKQAGYTQVLWLDGRENKFIEEVGTMNIEFIINDTLVTPPLEGSILGGITRDSLIHIVKNMGIKVKEERISIEEIINGIGNGSVQEIFGTGTAAVVTSVGQIGYKGKDYVLIKNDRPSKYTQKFYNEITGIQLGLIEDKFDWLYKVE